MIIGLAYLLVLASVPLARGRLTALADLPLRRPWLALAAIVIQILVISVLPTGDHTIHTTLHISSYFLLGAFAVANRHIVGVADHRVRRPARTSSRSRPTAASCPPTRTRSPRSRARCPRASSPTRRCSPNAQLPVPRRHLRHARLAAAAQRLQHRRRHPDARRHRARARRLRVAPHAARASRTPVRGGHRLMFRAALSGAPARRFFAAHAQSCLGTGLAYVALPLLAYERFDSAVGDRRGAAARPAAGDPPRARCSARWSTASAGAPARSSPTPCAASPSLVIMSADSLPMMIAGATIAGLGTALFAPAALAGLPAAAGDRRHARRRHGSLRRDRRPRPDRRPGPGRAPARRHLAHRP